MINLSQLSILKLEFYANGYENHDYALLGYEVLTIQSEMFSLSKATDYIQKMNHAYMYPRMMRIQIRKEWG